MAASEGKKFEEDIKKSIPDYCWYYRFKDGTAGFAGEKNRNVRFQAHNIADNQVMANKYLFILELKSHKGASIPFDCIRPTQLKEMSEIDHKLIKPYFVLNYRDHEKTYAVQAKRLKEFIDTTDRKSIPIGWSRENGIEIIGEKKKVRYRYDLERFFNEIEK